LNNLASADDVLREGDTIVVAGEYEALDRLAQPIRG
jgi:K+/H+ antiporter YhaU regulatory subunit KhtT